MSRIILIVTFAFMQVGICLAETEINLNSIEEQKLLVKNWECEWISAGNPNIFNGKYLINIQQINGTSVKGNFENTFCSDPKEFEGEIKKGKFHWTVRNLPKPCDCGAFKAKAQLFKDDDNVLHIKGRYKGCAGFGTRTADSGKFHCK